MNLRYSIFVGPFALAAAALITHDARSAATQRSYSQSHYALELAGIKAGAVKSVSGGNVAADVVEERNGIGAMIKKPVGNIKYEQIVVQFGLGMSRAFTDWLSDTTRQRGLAKDGAILGLDFNFVEKERRSFAHGLVTEVASPALDGASKEEAIFTVKIVPEQIRETPSSNTVVQSTTGARQARLLAANFRVDVPNVTATHVAHVDSISFRQMVHTDSVGAVHAAETMAGSVAPVSFAIDVGESDAPSWAAWAQHGDARPVQVVLLTPDLKSVLVEIDVGGAKVTSTAFTSAPGATVRKLHVQIVGTSAIFDFKPPPA